MLYKQDISYIYLNQVDTTYKEVLDKVPSSGTTITIRISYLLGGNVITKTLTFPAGTIYSYTLAGAATPILEYDGTRTFVFRRNSGIDYIRGSDVQYTVGDNVIVYGFNEYGERIDVSPKQDVQEQKVLVLDIPTISSLPMTISDNRITDDLVVLKAELGTPSAQSGDWEVTTQLGILTISGAISGSTTVKLYLMKQR